MAPNVTSSPTEERCAADETQLPRNENKNTVAEPPPKYRRKIMWPNVAMHAYLNLAALYGVYLMFTSAKLLTAIWGMYLCMCVHVFLIHDHMCL
jgi:stearoyl-CoA desaturase (delta-9 desaturase)